MYCTLIILSLVALVMCKDESRNKQLTLRTRNCVDVRFSLFMKQETWPLRPAPPQCGINECYNEFPTICQATCEDFNGHNNCDLTTLKARCECFPGFVRHVGICIEPGQCQMISRTKDMAVETPVLPKPGIDSLPVKQTNVTSESTLTTETPVKCGPHESWDKCGGGCPVTCKDRKKLLTCNRMCLPGCSCDEGYFQHTSGRCVSLKFCDLEDIHEKFWKTFMELIIDTV